MPGTVPALRTRPDVPAAAGRAAALLFGGVARVRRDRALHPDGLVFEARFESLAAPAGLGAEILATGFERPALVRIS